MDHRVVKTLSLSFTGVALIACQTDDPEQQCSVATSSSLPGPPQLQSARMLDRTHVQLTFTEPLAAFDKVDPASFRISWAFSSSGYAGEPGYTDYYDPMLLFCLSSDFCPGEYTDVIELSCAPGDPNSMVLTLDAFHPQICVLLGYYQDYEGYTSPLLPHFDAALATITDLDGEPLASISPEFVTTPDGALQVEGEFPNYPMPIPIDCY